MTRFIGIMSGKGGVGKTTTALNLGVALNNLGKDIIVLDGNLTTPHLGLYLGVSSVPIALHDAIEGKKSILNAVYRHASGVKIIPGDISIKALNKLDSAGLKKSLTQLRGSCEIMFVDMSAGLDKEVINIMKLVDEALIITTPDLLSVTDALKTVSLAEQNGLLVLGIVLNKVTGEESELSIANIESIIGKPIIAAINESKDISDSMAMKYPVVYSHPNSSASDDFKKLAALLVGTTYEPHLNQEKENWFTALLKKFGLIN